MEIKIVLFLPRDAASVPVSRRVLNTCLTTLGVTPETRSDIALALSEACSNVILHASPGEEYEVIARADDGRCVIEVINTGDGRPVPVPADSLPPETSEHGRGLKIIDAVTDNLRLTGNERDGTTVHFEKVLEWLPGAAGKQLLDDNQ